MNLKRNLVFISLGISLLLAGWFIISFGVRSNSPTASSTYGDTGSLVRYGPNNLVGKSLDEIGQRAVQVAQVTGLVKSGTPQVLLVRSIAREDMPGLGLNCIPEFMSIEQPPLVLVVLKGDFDLSNMPGLIGPVVKATLARSYLAYVFDVWAGWPVHIESSANGGRFRIVLNDPSLPEEATGAIAQCPPPSYKKTLHYGDTVPAPTPGPLHPDGSK